MTKCRVTVEESRNDTRRMELKSEEDWIMEQAVNEYDWGNLDDEVRDAVADNPIDATCIAQAVLYAIDNDVDIMATLAQTCSLYIKDFRATVHHIIEKRAERLFEDGE